MARLDCGRPRRPVCGGGLRLGRAADLLRPGQQSGCALSFLELRWRFCGACAPSSSKTSGASGARRCSPPAGHRHQGSGRCALCVEPACDPGSCGSPAMTGRAATLRTVSHDPVAVRWPWRWSCCWRSMAPITNPGGFARRIAFLTGPASGRLCGLSGGAADGSRCWRTWRTISCAVTAVWWCCWPVWGWRCIRRGARTVCCGSPDCCRCWRSFLHLCFNFTALRSDGRFLMPQAVLAAVYIGIAADYFAFAFERWRRLGGPCRSWRRRRCSRCITVSPSTPP